MHILQILRIYMQRKRRSGGKVLWSGSAALSATRRPWHSHLLIAALLCLQILAFALPGAAANAATITPQASASSTNPNVVYLRQLIQLGRMAASVHVLDSVAPTTLIQFPLVPSGIKQAFPQATGLVTIFRGDRDNSVADTVTVDVQSMPPNTTFTLFFIQFASKPFGNVEYVADLTTRGDGSGETVFQCIALVAFAMDARQPGTSRERTEGPTSGTNLEHLGMWFSSLADAQRILHNSSLPGTIFDGGSPPLHAGPQAMTDGQTLPVF